MILTGSDRMQVLEVLDTIKLDIMTLIETLRTKHEELSEIECCGETFGGVLMSVERRLRIENLAYDIITNRGDLLINSIKKLTETFFDESAPKPAV